MKQLLLRKGRVAVQDVPAPALSSHNLLIEVSHSLISTGTEMASVHLSGASLLTKAKERPQEVSKVLNSIRVRGLKKTLALVNHKLDEWKALGYSCSGRVLAMGSQVQGFQVGDRVACAGAGLANHAEVVSVPSTLVVKIPGSVSDAHASFVTIGAIALQGVRRADVRLGETVCVVGLGLIGQITVQLLTAAGCRVVGYDLDKSRVGLAMKNGLLAGASDPEQLKTSIDHITEGLGVDATLITASTSSSDPTRLSFDITRKKGKVVVVGAVGMDLQRSPFYEKEQDFLISCSYGPGRYDPEYELNAHDYPYAYVRWTENRNMQAFLELLGAGKLKMEPLLDKVFSIDEAPQAYQTLNQDGPKPLAVVLAYPNRITGSEKTMSSVNLGGSPKQSWPVRLGLIGVGNFMQTTHIPNLKRMSSMAKISGICAANSSTSFSMAKQTGANIVTTQYKDLLQNPEIDAVLIGTRHDKHALIAEEALRAGKHVFLEKPLALTMEEIDRLDQTVQGLNKLPVFMVGFNRRWAPMAVALKKELLNRQTPLTCLFRVNAGSLPVNHWINGPEGGGRLRGEACHMVDFFQFLVGSPLENISIAGLAGKENKRIRPDENFSAQYVYEDGSLCTLMYTAQGHSQFPKEWVEAHWMSRSALIDDFKRITFYGGSGRSYTAAQDKGHRSTLEKFFQAIQAGATFPTPWRDLVETSRAVIELDLDVWGKNAETCAES
ncbi:MAG: Inositol 2-dehydrogenase/D-chiro-inositol 3-dehydrogenase [Elusimicrobia bacterium]|nr:Inositol 2-dehydrogenase/D-chiro-inositol 3-dehydrogenase [Elusimicrobiota bacterium]